MAQQFTLAMHRAKLAHCKAYAIKRKQETGHDYMVDSCFCTNLDEPFNRSQLKRHNLIVFYTTKTRQEIGEKDILEHEKRWALLTSH